MPDISSLQAEIDRFTQIASMWNTAIIVLMICAAVSATGLVIAQKMAFVYSDKASFSSGKLTILKESISEGKLARAQQDAGEANEKAAKAQIELALLTGPPYLIPVIHGVGTPDLSKSSKQLVILTGDTLIKLPTLPKDKSLAWTLILTQDAVGKHQFKTLPKVTPENVLFNPPHSSWVLTLQTDSNGTIDTSLGGATYIAPPAK